MTCSKFCKGINQFGKVVIMSQKKNPSDDEDTLFNSQITTEQSQELFFDACLSPKSETNFSVTFNPFLYLYFY